MSVIGREDELRLDELRDKIFLFMYEHELRCLLLKYALPDVLETTRIVLIFSPDGDLKTCTVFYPFN